MVNWGARLELCLSALVSLLAVLFLAAFAAILNPAHAAGEERYDYDGLGRLVRVISSSGVITEYVYDAAGNITAVVRGAAAPPPTLTSISPDSIRRGAQLRVTLTGTNLQNAALQATDRELSISGVSRTDTSMAFDLAASRQATLGPSALRVSSAAGAATININVRPVLPTVELSPLPIAAPPDGRNATVDIVLSNADDQPHVVALTMAQTAIATVSPASLTIPAGQTRTSFFVAGQSSGNTELRLDSATLGNSVYPVFILADFVGINTARANLVGVYLAPLDSPPSGFSSLTAAPTVGLLKSGVAWQDTSPRFVSQGTTQSLRITGAGLPVGLTIAALPAEGLTFGAVTVAVDGASATVNVTAAANAAQGPRRLTVTAGQNSLTPLVAGADVLDVVAPLPQITSVQPILLAPGSTVAAFEIRGRNLQDVTSVTVGGGGVTASNSLNISPDGTLLTVGLQVSVAAMPGPRPVIVSAPSGDSGSTLTPFNTLTISDEAFTTYPTLLSPLVGLFLEGGDPPPTSSYTAPIPALAVGVAKGTLALTSTPATIARTETQTLRILGQGLSGANALNLVPATGLTLGALSVAGDGSEVSVAVTAAADAPLGLRRIELSAGGQPVRVGGTGALSIQVTPLAPVIDSIEPNTVLASGKAFTLTARGRNFQGATTVRVTPAAAITVGTPDVNAEGTELQVQLSIDPGATRGPRLVTIVGPASESSSASGPNNTLNISDGVALSELPSVIVGVMVGDPAPPDPVPPATAVVGAARVGLAVGTVPPDGLRDTVDASMVGVFLEFVAPPAQVSRDSAAAPAGVIRGPGALSLEPAALVPGQAAQLVVRGYALPAGASIQVAPAGAATLSGTVAVDPDGTAVRQTITVNAGAPRGLRVLLLKPDGTPVPAAAAAATTVAVVPGLPDVISLEPILARQGDTLTLLIRGQRLGEAVRLAAEPASGIDFASDFSVNPAGAEITVRMFIRDDAPLGARVIRVFNALGGSSADAQPANTFTVFPK